MVMFDISHRVRIAAEQIAERALIASRSAWTCPHARIPDP